MKEMMRFVKITQEQSNLARLMLPMFVVLAVVIWIGFIKWGDVHIIIIIAAILGFYMAMNIGANDVANNMWPAVGSKALTIVWAIIIAAIFEAAGAIIAGGDVVNTIKGGIIDGSQIADSTTFIYIMLATLFGSALWINIATVTKTPVSATHSVIGGLVGAGITAYGFWIVSWWKIVQIAMSWVISPMLGGVIAAFLLYSITKNILKKKDRCEAAKTWVPVYVALMGWSFWTYLLLKGLKRIIHVETMVAFAIGAVIAVLVYVSVKHYLSSHNGLFKNSKKSINKLFNIPLIFSAALLSFAHGANDVANAIGPLAAINDAISNSAVGTDAAIPIWVLIVGAIGISLWLAIYGSRLIKTVGSEITKLNQIRAYCVALSAAITVIVASLLGLPVSSTHIAIGGVFGVGLLREWMKHTKGKDKTYVERGVIRNIIMAWVITLPVSGVIAGLTYLALATIM